MILVVLNATVRTQIFQIFIINIFLHRYQIIYFELLKKSNYLDIMCKLSILDLFKYC